MPLFQKFMNIFKNPSSLEWFNGFETHHPNLKLQSNGYLYISAKDFNLRAREFYKYNIRKHSVLGKKNNYMCIDIHIYMYF